MTGKGVLVGSDIPYLSLRDKEVSLNPQRAKTGGTEVLGLHSEWNAVLLSTVCLGTRHGSWVPPARRARSYSWLPRRSHHIECPIASKHRAPVCRQWRHQGGAVIGTALLCTGSGESHENHPTVCRHQGCQDGAAAVRTTLANLSAQHLDLRCREITHLAPHQQSCLLENEEAEPRSS